MQIHNGYDEEKVVQSISESLDRFYSSLLRKIDDIKITDLMKAKNPYLYRAKAIRSAQEIVDSVMQAFISSSEETIFGNCFFEPLAIVASGGEKSIAEGIDLEVRDTENNTLYAIAVKSSTVIYNADSKKKQIENFQKGKKLATQGRLIYEPVVGFSYGQKRAQKSDKNIHTELAGEDFWTAITGDPLFYKKIIGFMRDLPEQYLERFSESYSKAQNRLVREFTIMFCDADGGIDWEKLVEYNSASLNRMDAEQFASDTNKLLDMMRAEPTISKKKLSELSGLSTSRVERIIKTANENGTLRQEGKGKQARWVF